MHLHYGLFAEILQELAKTASAIPEGDTEHHIALRDAAATLHRSLAGKPVHRPYKIDTTIHRKDEINTSEMSPEEEVRLLHIME